MPQVPIFPALVASVSTLAFAVLAEASGAATSPTVSVATLTVAAQNAPNALSRSIVSAQGSLSASDQKDLETFLDAWITQLAEGDGTRDLDDARRILTDPLRDLTATPAFFSYYSTAALPKLKPIVEGKDLRRAIHAMQVVRFIRTADAVALLASRISQDREPLAEKRLAAAGLLGEALGDANLQQPQFDSTIRLIEAAAAMEPNELVIIRQVDALGGIAQRQAVGNSIAAAPVSSAALARSSQVAILRSVAGKLAKSPNPTETVNAIKEIVIRLRNEWLNSGLKGKDLKTFGVTLAPALVDALAALQSQWDAGHRDASLDAAAQSLIGFIEPLLGLADAAARNSAGGTGKAFSGAWTSGDAAAFGKELSNWKATVSQTPYR
ncbi:MAG: hypothetical protein JNM94_14470 [Phycisphaerae bacterium]|nr:hypothetical protein [Phycisphaerae bacterium]